MSASASTISTRLEGVLQASRISAQEADRMKYAVGDAAPAAVVRPVSAEEAAEVVRFAASEKLSLIACGARTKLAIGMPPSRYDLALDMTALNRVAHYDPGDLTVSVDAGMKLAAIEQLLGEQNQFLPLAAPFHDEATIGGTIAAGMDSPLRHGYGTPRDFLIGAEFVNGTGAPTKSGGKVVKNVTGYDLHKLLIGSLGTLAVITRLNFRTFPQPALRRGFLAAFEDEQVALGFRQRVLNSKLTPVVVEGLSPEAARLLLGSGASSLLVGAGSWYVCVGFEGSLQVCERYAREISQMAQDSSAHDALVLREAQFAAILDQLREAIPIVLRSCGKPIVFRFCGLPGQTAALLRALQSFVASSWVRSAILLRSGGVIYVALLPAGEEESLLKQVAYFWRSVDSLHAQLDFHASIPFCPEDWKRELNVWGASDADVPMEIMHRVKRAFDPENVFAPGRFVGGL